MKPRTRRNVYLPVTSSFTDRQALRRFARTIKLVSVGRMNAGLYRVYKLSNGCSIIAVRRDGGGQVQYRTALRGISTMLARKDAALLLNTIRRNKT